MNRLLVLLLATASIAASGCTGIPEGTAANGALVTIDWTARDPQTGEVLAEGQDLRFVVGQGGSGLGRDLERSVVGRQENQTYSFVSEDDPTRAFEEEVRTPQLLGSDPAQGEVPIAAFRRSIGHDPEVNETFEFNPFYEAKVVAVGETNLTYRFHLPGGEQRDPVGFVGAVLVSRIEDGQLVRTLEPQVGARFTVDPPSPQNPATPLGLEPGAYVTVGAEDGDIIYRRSSVADPALADRPVEFEVTVQEVQRLVGGTTELEEGNYGRRPGSPYLNGDPSTVRIGDHHAGETHDDGAAHDDGHDDGHSGHDH